MSSHAHSSIALRSTAEPGSNHLSPKVGSLLEKVTAVDSGLSYLLRAKRRPPKAAADLEGHGKNSLSSSMLNEITSRLQKLNIPGWLIGLDWNLDDLSLIGYGLMNCRTYGEFTDGYINQMDYMEHPLRTVSTVEDGKWVLSMYAHDTRMSPEALRFCIEENCASVFSIFRAMTGRSLCHPTIELSLHDRERDEAGAELLDAEIVSGMPQNRLIMSLRDRNERLSLTREKVDRYCAVHCAMILPTALAQGGVPKQVRDELLFSLGKPPSLDDVAASLNVSKRTLNRRLHDSGWTYQKMVNQYRADYANALFEKTTLSTKEIAYMCGYGNYKSFKRRLRMEN